MNTELELMAEVEEVFKLAFNQVLASRGEVDKAIAISTFATFIQETKPFAIANAEGIASITPVIFGVPETMDLIEDLIFHFFSRWGYRNNRLETLCSNLAYGICGDFETRANTMALSCTPQEFSDRYPKYEDTTNFLMVNRWAVVILLAQLCITLDDREVTSARKVLASIHEAAQ